MSGPDYQLEYDAHARGFTRVCGADEAGRGPLAGPVVAAAVILDPSSCPRLQELGLNDSKAISQSRRERILNALYDSAHIEVYVAEPLEIERKNILWASLDGMAICAKRLAADYALLDGNRLPKSLECSGDAIIKGDARCLSIAAASIVAKVTRDRLMIEANARFPGYGFAKHKGYPTAAHLDALNRLGPCPIHRRGFGPVGRLL
ncbi:MAG: ribonuclease HII [Pseudomonadota bacterium]